MGGNIGWKLSWSQSGAGVCTRLTGESNEKPLVTTDQAEIYAQARVNEALEEAASICDADAASYQKHIKSGSNKAAALSCLCASEGLADAIRALKTKEQP